MSDRIAHRLGQIRDGGDAIYLLMQPGLQRVDDRPTSLVAHPSSVLGRMAADLGLDRIELANARQHLGGQWRFRGDPEVVKPAPHVRPAECQGDRAVDPIAGKALEPGIPVDLQYAPETGQVPRRALALAVLRVGIDRHRMMRSAPGAMVDGITPKPPGLGPP